MTNFVDSTVLHNDCELPVLPRKQRGCADLLDLASGQRRSRFRTGDPRICEPLAVRPRAMFSTAIDECPVAHASRLTKIRYGVAQGESK